MQIEDNTKRISFSQLAAIASAAITAAQCGHHVKVYDKDKWVGGSYRIASIPPGKGEIANFCAWQAHALKELGVPVILNTEVTKELVEQEQPDVIIAATGVTPIIPKKIPGVDKDLVVLEQDVLSSAVNTGQRVVVAGGGLVGVEVANYLASLLKDVTIVEMREGIALDETPAPRKDLLRDIHNNGVRVLTETSVKEIKAGSVVVTGKTEEEIPADTVVLAIGRVSNTVLADQLKEAGYDVRVIGDAHTPALAGAANREGHLTALSL